MLYFTLLMPVPFFDTKLAPLYLDFKTAAPPSYLPAVQYFDDKFISFGPMGLTISDIMNLTAFEHAGARGAELRGCRAEGVAG